MPDAFFSRPVPDDFKADQDERRRAQIEALRARQTRRLGQSPQEIWREARGAPGSGLSIPDVIAAVVGETPGEMALNLALTPVKGPQLLAKAIMAARAAGPAALMADDAEAAGAGAAKSARQALIDAVRKRKPQGRDLAAGEPVQGKMGEVLSSQTPPMVPPTGETRPIFPRPKNPEDLYTPGVAQEPMPRLTDTGRVPKLNERSQALLASQPAARGVSQLIERGRRIQTPTGSDLTYWYGTEPYRQFALNEGLTQSEFDRLLGHMSGASQRNPVDQQNKMGSLMWEYDKSGLLVPSRQLWTNKLAKEGVIRGPQHIALPEGYGSLAQGDIFRRSQRIAGGDVMGAMGDDKLGSFYANLRGNLAPGTMDVNAVRGPVLMAKDARWLRGQFHEKDELGNVIATHNPRKDYQGGILTLDQALERPGFWEAAPATSGEYGAFEDIWRRGAKRNDIRTAEGQALGWYGSADITALKSPPELYIENLERMARRAALRRGVTPMQALKDHVKGREHLGYIDPRLLIGAGFGSGATIAALRSKNEEP